MPDCSAVNCTNRSENSRMFKIPTDLKRKAKWIQNMRRDNWIPTSSSRLCEIHFEQYQFEQNRQDNWRKLKPNAVPTLFNVPNPPAMINPPPRKSLYKKRDSVHKSEDVKTAPDKLQEIYPDVASPIAQKSIPACNEQNSANKSTHLLSVQMNEKLHDSTPNMPDNFVQIPEIEVDTTVHQLNEIEEWKYKYNQVVQMMHH